MSYYGMYGSPSPYGYTIMSPVGVVSPALATTSTTTTAAASPAASSPSPAASPAAASPASQSSPVRGSVSPSRVRTVAPETLSLAAAMEAEYGTADGPATSDVVPPTMDPLEFGSAMESGSAKREELGYIESVSGVVTEVTAAIDQLRLLPIPSSNFDDMKVTDQLDAILPPVESILPANAAAIEAMRGVAYDGPRTMLGKVAERIATMKAASAGMPNKIPLFDKLAGYVDEATTLLDGTRNIAAEVQFCLAVSDLLDKIESVPSAFSQPEMLARALKLDTSCGMFEVRREAEDWTENSQRDEDHLYREVDAVLEATEGHQATNMETYSTLTSFTVLPQSISTAEAEALITRVQDQLAALREAEAASDRAAALLSDGVAQYLVNCKNSQLAAAETVEKLTAHILNQLADLGDAHLALWRETKRIKIIERSQGMLARKIRVNASLAEGEEEQAYMLLEDAKADVAVTNLTNETNGDVCADLADLANDRLDVVVTELFEMMTARLALTSRKHFKTALQAFAVESSVGILKQEREGLLVKKQRSNAAQRADWVADCTRAVEDIDARIAAEEARLAATLEERKQVRELWEFLFEALASLNLTPAYEDALHDIKSEFKGTLTRLKSVESTVLSAIQLKDELDATFLSSSFTS